MVARAGSRRPLETAANIVRNNRYEVVNEVEGSMTPGMKKENEEKGRGKGMKILATAACPLKQSLHDNEYHLGTQIRVPVQPIAGYWKCMLVAVYSSAPGGLLRAHRKLLCYFGCL